VASIDQTAAVTGWRPHNDLRAGVRRTWEWATARGTCLAAA
jgi:hypothetical protein